MKNERGFEYLLFDWDGTLVNSLPLWVESWRLTFEDFGITVSEEEVLRTVFVNWRAPEDMGVSDFDGFVECLYNHLNELMSRVEFMPGVVQTLEVFSKEDKLMAIVTSSRRKIVKKVLERFRIEHLFCAVLGEEDTRSFKPDPEIVNMAIEVMGGDKKECVIIGDSDKDVRAGFNSGISTVVFFPKINEKFYNKSELVKLGSDYFIDNFEDLTKIV